MGVHITPLYNRQNRNVRIVQKLEMVPNALLFGESEMQDTPPCLDNHPQSSVADIRKTAHTNIENRQSLPCWRAIGTEYA